MEYFGYVYKTEIIDKGHPFDGCFYIGQIWSSKFVPNYYGSGQKIKNYISQRGTEHLQVSALDWASSLEELNQKEQNWIRKYLNTTPLCLNAKVGGGQSSMGAEARKRQAERMREYMKGNTYTLGYRHSELSKRRISDASKEKWQDPEYRSKQLARLKGSGNPMYGKKHTAESLEKMRAAARKRRATEATKAKHSEHSSKCRWWTDGVVEHFCEFCPDGFFSGRLRKNENIQ